MPGWLPREEITLLFGAVAALGLFALGVLELFRPAGPRRARRRTVPAGVPIPAPRVFGAVPSAPLVSPECLVALVERAQVEIDSERRTVAPQLGDAAR